METMRQGLSGFLVRLGDEPELFEEFMRNQDGVMEREQLTAAERDVILGGDLREIRARLRKEYSEPDEAMAVMEEKPEPEEPPTIMEPEEPPTVMEPEEPPTVMEPEEPPTIMEPEEPPTIMDPDPEREARAD
jgi:hypothetical protein